MEINENMQAALDWFTGAPLNITIIILLTIFISRLGQRSITRLMNRVASADLIPGPKRSDYTYDKLRPHFPNYVRRL